MQLQKKLLLKFLRGYLRFRQDSAPVRPGQTFEHEGATREDLPNGNKLPRSFSPTLKDEMLVLFEAYTELAYNQMQPTPGEPDSGHDRPFILSEQQNIFVNDINEAIKEAVAIDV